MLPSLYWVRLTPLREALRNLWLPCVNRKGHKLSTRSGNKELAGNPETFKSKPTNWDKMSTAEQKDWEHQRDVEWAESVTNSIEPTLVKAREEYEKQYQPWFKMLVEMGIDIAATGGIAGATKSLAGIPTSEAANIVKLASGTMKGLPTLMPSRRCLVLA